MRQEDAPLLVQNCPLQPDWPRRLRDLSFRLANPEDEARLRHAHLVARGAKLMEIDAKWEIAHDDPSQDTPEKDSHFFPGYPRHVHASLDVDGRRVHIDYIWAHMWGPGRSKNEIHIFVDDRLAGFGGHWGTSLGASSSISSAVALLDDRRALVFDGPSPALQDDSKTACS